MKKNIALFMAGAMALSTLPFNVFAASSNTVSNLFVGKTDATFTSDATVGTDKYAPYLRFTLKDEMIAGRAFEITLDNAEWSSDYDATSILLGTDTDTPSTAGIVNADETQFEVTVDGDNLTIKPLVNFPEDTAIIVPVFGKFEGGEAITATVNGGYSVITGGTYSLTNYTDGDVKVEGDTNKLTIKEDVAGVLDVESVVDADGNTENEDAGKLYIQIKGSKAQWDDNGNVGVSGTRFGITDDADEDYRYTGVTETIDDNMLTVNYQDVAVNNDSGLEGTLEVDLSEVLDLTDRDYKGVIEVYVWGSGIEKSDKELVQVYDTRLTVDAEVETDDDDKVEQLISGRTNQTASKVTLEEKYDGSIRDDRYIKFELQNAEFTLAQEIEFNNLDEDVTQDSPRKIDPEKDSNGYYTTLYIDKDDFTFEQGEKNKLTFTPEINIDAEYTGEIVMTVSGPGISDEFELVIAETVAPITVDTEITHIKAGFTNIPTADITIKENFAGALPTGVYKISVDKAEVMGGLKIAEVKEETIEGDELEVEIIDVDNASYMEFEVLAETKDEPGEFTITGVEIYADSTVPTSKYNFQLSVEGSTNEELEEYKYSDDEIHAYFYEFDYMTTGNLDNESNGNNTSTAGLNTNVGITLGETAYTVDGVYAGELIAPAYVSNSGSTMVPVRALSYALGVSEDSIFWHQATQTVTIEVSKDRTAQFTVGSDLCTINGIQYPIISANGKTDVVEVKDGYTYLPLRFLGEKVFGVTVEWDNATQTATFN